MHDLVKRTVGTSLVIAMSLTLLFSCVFALMSSLYKNENDYSGALEGRWRCAQYYVESQAFMADIGSWQELEFTDGIVTGSGTILGDFEGTYSVVSGVSLVITTRDDHKVGFVLDVNSSGQLLLRSDDLTLLLDRA